MKIILTREQLKAMENYEVLVIELNGNFEGTISHHFENPLLRTKFLSTKESAGKDGE